MARISQTKEGEIPLDLEKSQLKWVVEIDSLRMVSTPKRTNTTLREETHI